MLPTLDNLATGTPLQIFAELTLDVSFTIVVRPGTPAADVATVAAFPVAAAQVRHWLADAPARTRKWCRPTRMPRPRTMSPTGAPTPA